MELEREERQDRISGVKAATLEAVAREGSITVRFRGTGWNITYGTESTAVCGKQIPHDVPDPDCTCGFWLVSDHDLVHHNPASSSSFLLEAELGGTIIQHERGWRGQTQRIMSVTPPAWCGCNNPGWYLALNNGHSLVPRKLTVTCDRCMNGSEIPDPRSWLAGKLRTEVRGEFLGMKRVPALVQDHGTEAITSMINELRELSRLVMYRSSALVPGRTWRYFITDTGMVLEIGVAAGGQSLLLMLMKADPATGQATLIWRENMPV